MGERVSEATDVSYQQGSCKYFGVLESESTFGVVLDESGTGDAVYGVCCLVEGSDAARLFKEVVGGEAGAVLSDLVDDLSFSKVTAGELKRVGHEASATMTRLLQLAVEYLLHVQEALGDEVVAKEALLKTAGEDLKRARAKITENPHFGSDCAVYDSWEAADEAGATGDVATGDLDDMAEAMEGGPTPEEHTQEL